MGETQNRQSNQQGMVSFVVTLFLMVVITLIVIGYSQISRREQRESLDRQLSSQAFYAAESAVNDAIEAISLGYSNDKTQCGADTAPATSPFYGPTYGQIDPANNVSYSCLLITQKGITNLTYNPIAPGSAVSSDMSFKDSSGTPKNVSSITLRWSYNGGATGYPNFTPTKTAPVLRLTLTNLDLAGAYKRDNLNRNSFTVFVYPHTTGTSYNFTNQATVGNLNQQGRIQRAFCSGTTCQTTIGFAGTTTNHVFLRATAIYAPVNNLSITAKSGSDDLTIGGAQVIVDATGKAQDVIRRIQVRVPVNAGDALPSNYALQVVHGICKQLNVTSVASSDGCVTTSYYDGSP